jgi:hypothetical protein
MAFTDFAVYFTSAFFGFLLMFSFPIVDNLKTQQCFPVQPRSYHQGALDSLISALIFQLPTIDIRFGLLIFESQIPNAMAA